MLATRTRRGLALATVALAAALTAAALPTHGSAGRRAEKASVRATAVACGATITTSTTLANDLTNCVAGLDVAASNVVLNLNGHRIGGGGPDGVLVDPGRNGVTVENGTINGFVHGIAVRGDGAKILNMRITSAVDGVMLFGSGDVVSGSTIFENSGLGIGALGPKAVLLNDAVRDNGDKGIDVQAANATLSGDRVLSNASDGIDVEEAGATLTSNTANGNSADGIHLEAEIATLSKNAAFFNTKLGIEGQGGVSDLGGNRADENGSAHQCRDVVCS
jgi:parallel beta-helix repeat protein